jgi:transposase
MDAPVSWRIFDFSLRDRQGLGMPNRVRTVAIRDGDRPELERMALQEAEAVRVAERARIVLLAAEGMTGRDIAACVGCSEPTVITWRRRYAADGIDGLIDRPRPGAPPRVITDAVRREIIAATLRPPPAAAAAGPWSSRRLATWLSNDRGIEISRDSICRVWRNCGIAPATRPGFKLVVDPSLRAGRIQVLGLYLKPPQCALVLRFAADDRADGGPAWGGGDETRSLVSALRAGPRRSGSTVGPPADLSAYLARAADRWPHADLRAISGRLPPGGGHVPRPRTPLPRVRVYRSRDDVAWPSQVGVCVATSRPRGGGVPVTVAMDEIRSAVAMFLAAWPLHPIPFSWFTRRED